MQFRDDEHALNVFLSSDTDSVSSQYRGHPGPVAAARNRADTAMTYLLDKTSSEIGPVFPWHSSAVRWLHRRALHYPRAGAMLQERRELWKRARRVYKAIYGE